MLRTFLETELRKFVVETHSPWFQQDGVTAHTARTAVRDLNEKFPTRVISRRGNIEWPASTPDLNACNFFLLGHSKIKVYEKKPRTTVDLK
jgi:hypothetical protein